MHALLAHAYHLLLLPAHLAARPAWRSLAACLAVAIAARRLGRGAAAGAVPVVIAWAVLAPIQGWPPTPVARLTGLGAIILGGALLARGRRRPWGWLCGTAALSAWWLRGLPLDVGGLAGCVPVFAGLAAGWAGSRRLTQGSVGWAVFAGAALLAASLLLAGAAPHWAQAALAPAFAALILLGVPGAMPMLAGMVVIVGAAALVASDRGRILPVDAACLSPLLLWAGLASFRHRGSVAATRL